MADMAKNDGMNASGKGEFGRFLVVGCTTVAIDFLVYWLLTGLGLSPAVAKAISFVSGTVFAYFANKLFTFQTHGSSKRMSLFVGLYMITLLVNVGLNSLLLSAFFGWSFASELAFLGATGVSAVLNFIGMKKVVFNDSVEPKENLS